MKWILAILVLAIILIAGCTQQTTSYPELTAEQVEAMRNTPIMDLTGGETVCKGTARCFNGTVTRIVDGDTLYVDNNSIRLALVNASELKVKGGRNAEEFVSSVLCPVGSTALVDEDDGQTAGSYGRIVAVVYCKSIYENNSINLNLNLITNGYATVYGEFCNVSEFSKDYWAKNYGC